MHRAAVSTCMQRGRASAVRTYEHGSNSTRSHKAGMSDAASLRISRAAASWKPVASPSRSACDESTMPTRPPKLSSKACGRSCEIVGDFWR